MKNGTGVRLVVKNPQGLLDAYKPPTILEPGEVAFFLVKKEEWALSFHIQVFEGPAAAWLVADLLPPRQQTPPVARGTEGPTIGSSNQFQIGLIFEGQTFIEVGEPTPTKYNTKIIFGRSYDTEKNLWKSNALQEVLDKVDP